MNTRFLCTEVVGRKLTQLYSNEKHIGSNGTFIVDMILSPALSDVHDVSLMPRLLVGEYLTKK